MSAPRLLPPLKPDFELRITHLSSSSAVRYELDLAHYRGDARVRLADMPVADHSVATGT